MSNYSNLKPHLPLSTFSSSPPACPFGGCTNDPGVYHIHYHPAIYDESKPQPCPWPNCRQLRIHAHRYNPSGAAHDVDPHLDPFSFDKYFAKNPDMKAKQQEGFRKARVESFTQQAKPKVPRPFFFRDPSWSGEPASDDEGGDNGKEKEKPKMEVVKPVMAFKKPSKRPVIERRHTLAGMVVVEDI